MKRWIWLAVLLATATTAQADNRSQVVLQQLTSALKSLGGYSVIFEVQTGRGIVSGYYEVNGDNYYMQVDNMEVYGDAQLRYEVSAAKREVVIDRVDITSHNLLNNPTRAFEFIEGEYASSLLSEGTGKAVIRLTPKRIQSAVGNIDVEVDLVRSMPVSVVYEIDGDRVRIDIRSVIAREASPRTFDASDYPGYERIDFR